MDVRRLGLLRELAQRGSVTAVARALHLTPSAVSQQLKALEREAGVRLTQRSGRGIALTVPGRMLAETGDNAFRLGHVEHDSYNSLILSDKLIGAISSSNLPAAWAAQAFCWLAAPYSSIASRPML